MEQTFQLRLTKETYIKAKDIDEASRLLEVFVDRQDENFIGQLVFIRTNVELVSP
jgi:hypothetical protein